MSRCLRIKNRTYFSDWLVAAKKLHVVRWSLFASLYMMFINTGKVGDLLDGRNRHRVPICSARLWRYAPKESCGTSSWDPEIQSFAMATFGQTGHAYFTHGFRKVCSLVGTGACVYLLVGVLMKLASKHFCCRFSLGFEILDVFFFPLTGAGC